MLRIGSLITRRDVRLHDYLRASKAPLNRTGFIRTKVCFDYSQCEASQSADLILLL